MASFADVTLPRLRQVALVAADLHQAADALRGGLGLTDPFQDPGVGEFGLDNVVFGVGDTFLEVVAPVREGTTAGRYLERQGGDGGYMAIFQVADMAEARRRVAALDIRVVWQADLDDISGTHLHPKDVRGAIVSLDEARPEPSWRWAGPAWTGGAPANQPGGGIVSLTVATPRPEELAARWAAVLGIEADGAVLPLDGGAQRVSFVAPADGREGIVAGEARVEGAEGGTATVGSATVRISPLSP